VSVKRGPGNRLDQLSTEAGWVRTDERQRMARELHDSTSQILVVLRLDLGRLKRLEDPSVAPLVSEMEDVIEQIHEEIRASCSAD